MRMNFYIEKIILWLKDGRRRELKFENDKINIVTGNSKTGKTAILEIIDYCFCGSESNISYENIGENVLWYGLNFYINGKKYTIARGELKNETLYSDEYYFSPIGDIPEKPNVTIGEHELKSIIEKEFSINYRTTFGYGGNTTRKNSKISYRYFLIFNTLSGDVVDHSKNYFDKLDIDRYREALPRIFDLALGITTIKNIMILDKIMEYEHEIYKLEKEFNRAKKENENKSYKLKLIIKKAKESKIISNKLGFDEAVLELNKIFKTGILPLIEFSHNNILEELNKSKQILEIQISNLNRFKSRYAIYKKDLEKEKDALKPIKYIKKTFADNITNDEYRQFLNILEEEFEKIKIAIKEKLPFEYRIDNEINKLQCELDNIKNQIDIIPIEDESFITNNNRLITLGEIKSEFNYLINQEISTEKIDLKIKEKEKELNKWKNKYTSLEEQKEVVINALNEYIQTYIEESEDALDEYSEYLATFDYKRKVLKLRKSKSTSTANITSSSDHLFMHLCMFLGMHHLIIDNNIPYILPYLIIDQPSRPYFNNNKFDYKNSEKNMSKKDDWNKVKQIFILLDKFLDNILDKDMHFQIILLEHVSVDAWDGCKHINLVEIFDGEENALIPPKNIINKI